MLRFLRFLPLLIALTVCSSAQPLIRPFTFVMPSWDSLSSEWLPSMPREIAGSRGVLRVGDDGHFEYADGSRARFVGVTMSGGTCFPDSVSAVSIAARLAKLGVNIVRFQHFDYHNSNSQSVLAPGTRSDTLSAAQMKRLDWFLHQLTQRGIHAHMVLKSRNGPRADDGVPGSATTYNNGQIIQFFSAPMRAMQKRALTALLSHVNQYTGLRYADDPAIALMTVVDQATPWYHWTLDYLNERANILSAEHSQLLDSLYAGFLRGRYGSTAALAAAYREGIEGTAPNSIRNPGFEAFTDEWELSVGEAAQASLVVVQGTDVPSGGGTSSLRVVVRATNGNEGRITLQQSDVAVRRDGIYRLRFRAKTDTAIGRPLRVYHFRGVSPFTSLGLDTSFALTTEWQTFTATYRAAQTDSLSATLRFYIGRSAGDVFLDGIELEETGRPGLAPGETIEDHTVARARYAAVSKYARRRATDLAAFYDSLGRAYFSDMSAHLRSLGVRAPIAATNNVSSSIDARTVAEHDFTSESATWDFNGARAGSSYSDSTWVIRQYSILNSRDQRIPELSRAAIAGKPFIVESYGHAYPNRNRAEMMLYLPAYASLHDWDGAYLHNYTASTTDIATRRRAIKDDFYQIANDPSVAALLPQLSAIMRNRWIRPATRTIEIAYDSADLADLAVNVATTHNNSYNTDGGLSNVMNMVHAVRVGTFDSPRHLTAGDYYFTLPEDDRIESDTREIVRDVTKGTMALNTPYAQGAAGRIAAVSSIGGDDIGLSWIDGAETATVLWTSLDEHPLDSARRSLLTVATRSLNAGALWQFGDSSLGKNWGSEPTQLEGTRLGLNFYTDADSLTLIPLDSTGRPTDRTIDAVRSGDSWRVIVDISDEGTPWFGVRQVFGSEPTTHAAESRSATVIGELAPMPVAGRSSLRVSAPVAGAILVEIRDALGRLAAPTRALPGPSALIDIDGATLHPGFHTLTITVAGERHVRRFVVVR